LRNLSLFSLSLLNKYKCLNEQDLEIFMKQIYIPFENPLKNIIPPTRASANPSSNSSFNIQLEKKKCVKPFKCFFFHLDFFCLKNYI
jgi:hypothetical protein